MRNIVQPHAINSLRAVNMGVCANTAVYNMKNTHFHTTNVRVYVIIVQSRAVQVECDIRFGRFNKQVRQQVVVVAVVIGVVSKLNVLITFLFRGNPQFFQCTRRP